MSSKSLVERLKFWRAERPDEWQMDEFIRDAVKLEQERNELAAQVVRLQSCIQEAINALDVIQERDFPGDLQGFKELLHSTISESPRAASALLKQEWNCPTVEHGRNRYGLDVAYFRNLFNRELNRTLQDYRPHELARNLLRMARTADESVIAEAEFSGALKAQWQAEAFDSPVIETSMKVGCIGEFSFAVKGSGICPVCAKDGLDRDCEVCDGNYVVDLTVEVPWDTQEAIFKSMCKYKADAIRHRTQEVVNYVVD